MCGSNSILAQSNNQGSQIKKKEQCILGFSNFNIKKHNKNINLFYTIKFLTEIIQKNVFSKFSRKIMFEIKRKKISESLRYINFILQTSRCTKLTINIFDWPGFPSYGLIPTAADRQVSPTAYFGDLTNGMTGLTQRSEPSPLTAAVTSTALQRAADSQVLATAQSTQVALAQRQGMLKQLSFC